LGPGFFLSREWPPKLPVRRRKNVFFWLVIFIGAIVVLWKTSDQVLKRVKDIALAFGVSELAVTILGISILASLPEFLVSIIAAVKKTSDVSLGTVIGSNIFTLLVVLGLAALIRPFHVRRVIEERDSNWMLLAGAVILVLIPQGISRWEGLVLMGLYFPYIFSVFQKEKKEKKSIRAGGRRRSGKDSRNKWLALFLVGGNMVLMLVSAALVLKSCLKIAQALHLPRLIVSLILIGIGSSIPETAIGVTSSLRKKTEVTLGDVYGTNIFTCLFILGVSALIHPVPAAPQVQSFILPFFIFSTIILQIFFAANRRVSRGEGVFLILLYFYFALASLQQVPYP
jgi:cation:H+ antiporter